MTGELRFACLSETGPVREHNEDNFCFFGKVMPAEHQASGLLDAKVSAGQPFVVGLFDGMGGEADGEIASCVAATALKERAFGSAWSETTLNSLLLEMNEAVHEEGSKRHVQMMGTTATLLANSGEESMFIANLGDSPAYLFADGELSRLARAHTDAAILERLGIEDRKPGLTQFLGMTDEGFIPTPHVAEFELPPGGSVLLASDGLTDVVDEDDIAAILASPSMTDDKVTKLRDLALDCNSTDNVTVILCERVSHGEH